MKQTHLEILWERVKARLAEIYSRAIRELIFEDVRIRNIDDESVTLVTDSGFKYNEINTKYRDGVEKAFEEAIRFHVHLYLIFDGEPTDIERLTRQITDVSEDDPPDFLFKPRSGKSVPMRPLTPEEDAQIYPFREGEEPVTPLTKDYFLPKQQGSTFPASSYEYTFENFIVGSSNKFAQAACVAVTNDPASNFNPLFIHGQSGLGKTHLMYAVLNRIRKRSPGVNILYIKGEEFTNELVESIRRNTMPEFRAKFRSCDVLLIDDIQFVAGKESTQEEIFHTFNALYEDHKQIILTSDRPPKDIKTLEDRLKTRFEWGLIADIQPPDLELRVAILKKKCEENNLAMPQDILTFLAENLRSNIRQLEGVVKKLSAMTFLTGDIVTMQMAQACITEFVGSEEPVSVTIDRIFSLVEQKMGVSKADMVGPSRVKNVATARHVAVYLIRNITDISHPNIGRIFNRDHTTVMASCTTVERRMLSDTSFAFTVSEMLKSLKNKQN
ncbi:MAG: chromosomal replication initiator protein DnaA [Clostridia bacterium]|nr:chromosomal replication initiator protein DnaA [Clostridia bacterium]